MYQVNGFEYILAIEAEHFLVTLNVFLRIQVSALKEKNIGFPSGVQFSHISVLVVVRSVDNVSSDDVIYFVYHTLCVAAKTMEPFSLRMQT